ncbi:MAG TPA: hypothetical protein QGF58_15965 [Myxococcota bacterium]|nr:hypothetical protein [Myxococcota bacterium]
MTPKATSVTATGELDGFEPPLAYRGEVDPSGATRLAISVPPDRLAQTHAALLAALSKPVSVLYVRLVDRQANRQLEEPHRLLALDVPEHALRSALQRCATLLYRDARHQLWLRGAMQEQLVLDELGMVWVYPDDPSFRDVLEDLGIPESPAPNMEGRDHVRVDFKASADAEEEIFISSLGLSSRSGPPQRS